MKKIKLTAVLSLSFAALFSVNVMAATVKDLLCTGLEPMGKCLYVYGGGWNEKDTGAGKECVSYGTSPRWEEFYNKNNSGYNWKATKYRIHDGLDCTGYTGWIMYQLFGDKYSSNGYVFTSGTMAENYAKIFGSEIIKPENIILRQSGDVMAKNGHVYIVVGQCEDGSFVIMHASPPSVSLCGTADRNKNSSSQAVKLAKEYMEKYFPEEAARYKNYSRAGSEYDTYMRDFSEIKWKNEVLSDPDGYRSMNAEEVLKDLFENVKVYCGENRIADEYVYLSGNIPYISLRNVCEELNCDIKWDELKKESEIVFGDKAGTVSAAEGSIKNNRLYVSTKLLESRFGINIKYDEKTKSVYISK